MKTALLATLGVAATLALTMPPPAFAIERIGWSKTRETMYIHGKIEPGDAKIVEAAIAKNRRTLRGIILNSGGGNVMEGIELAQLILDKDYDTGVTRGGTCASACFMMWAAGKNRHLYADSTVGIHSSGFHDASTGGAKETAVSFAMTMAMARIYGELKVPYHLIGAMVMHGPNDMYWLTATDYQWMNARVMN
jgi:hypothetical protein